MHIDSVGKSIEVRAGIYLKLVRHKIIPHYILTKGEQKSLERMICWAWNINNHKGKP